MAEVAWVRLQRKIFGRWVFNKLRNAEVEMHPPVNDIVKDLSGWNLAHLVACLSESAAPSSKKVPKTAKMRVHKIDSANNALSYTYDAGVTMKGGKCSAENLVNGEERPVLGLVWAIMQRFMKFGDEDENQGLDAQTALLKWVQQQLRGYAVEVNGFGKDFHDGLALAALIHKHRPKLIDFDSLTPGNGNENLPVVFDAAERFFGLEKYLEIGEVAQLDSKSMVVYVSEYYYGIAAQRRLDLASKRIAKLIAFTKKNDALKAQYLETAKRNLEGLSKWNVVLGDRTIDNTLQGARDRLAEFERYQKEDKGQISADYLELEGLYGIISLRLSDNNRPKFEPGADYDLLALQAALKKLEAAEAERNEALNKELNRQLLLVKLAEQHKAKVANSNTWTSAKIAYLSEKDACDNSGEASYKLALLDAFANQFEAFKSTQVPSIKQLGAKLAAEKYENISVIHGDEASVDDACVQVTTLIPQKKAHLEAELAREKAREAASLKFANQASILKDWVADNVSEVQNTAFGFTLEEVQANEAVILADAERLKSEGAQKIAEIRATYDEGMGLSRPFDPTVYTSETMESLEAAVGSLTDALAARDSSFQEELALQVKNDNLCQAFARVANPFVEDILAKKLAISNDESDLESLLKKVESHIGANEGAALDEINSAYAAIEGAGITYNKHSLHTASSIRIVWDDYQNFLNRKKEQIEENILQKKLRGLTPEQFEEIDSQFKEFDKDGSGELSTAEFKSALYALGYDKSKKEVNDLVTKFGDGSQIRYDGFKEFMIMELGDTMTKDEIERGFRLIARMGDTLVMEWAQDLFSDENLEYIKTNSPPKGDGVDYVAFTEDQFSR